MSAEPVIPNWYEGIAGDPGGGPYIILRLQISGGVIAASDFEANGCPASQICAASIASLAKGREVEPLQKLDSEDLIRLVGGLPEGKGHYAELAIVALRKALMGHKTSLEES